MTLTESDWEASLKGAQTETAAKAMTADNISAAAVALLMNVVIAEEVKRLIPERSENPSRPGTLSGCLLSPPTHWEGKKNPAVMSR